MTTLREKIDFLSRPQSYNAPVARVEVRETHMSWVFLTDDLVYKLKKPVRYSFLDFRTIARRHFYCAEELRLNQRLAASTYKAIVPLRRKISGDLTLSCQGKITDWLVVMRRLPESETLDARIHSTRILPADLERVGELLAGFYAGASPEEGAGDRYFRHFVKEQRINRRILQNPLLKTVCEAGPALEALDDALRFSEKSFVRWAADRKLVEGHGDLRPEHIFLVEPIQIIDCLEFNRSMRIVDPFDEVNYLSLECEMLGAPWIRPLLLDRVERRIGGRPDPRLMAVYTVFRALLRARLCLAHLLEIPVRDRDRWRPLALRYIAIADAARTNLPNQ